MKIPSQIFYAGLIALLVAACSQGGSRKESKDEASQSEATHAKSSGRVVKLGVRQFEMMREAGVQAIVIDVRTPKEVAKGKIPDALEIDYEADDFEQKIDGLEKEKSYILYCAAGGRSSKAGEIMLQKGFKNVFNLEGGYDAWIKEVSK